ncbi:DUF4823 domain-containing protein [Saccharophagus degradans]|uniref:DUF4823 domain-containing protein n=2 Tax=Saccharophagus degradans TaxID=86304 RepID=UPI003A7F7DC9
MQKNNLTSSYLLCAAFIVVFVSGCTSQYASNVYRGAMQTLKLNQSYQLTRKEPWVIAADTHLLLMKTAPEQSQLEAMNAKAMAATETQWLVANQTLAPRLNTAMFAALQQSLISQFGSVSVTQSNSVSEALAVGRGLGAQLLLVPAAISSEDNLNTQIEINQGSVATSRTLGVDASSIRIAAYDVNSGKLVDLAQVQARGRYFAASDENTQELAAKAARVYVAAIAGGSL